MLLFTLKSGNTSPVGFTCRTGAVPSGQLFAGNRKQVGRNDRRPNITLERSPSFPGAPIQPQTALEPGYARLNAGPETTKALVHMLAAAHLLRFQTAFFGKANVFDSFVLGGLQIRLGSKPSVQGDFERAAPINYFLPIEHRLGQSRSGWTLY